MAILVRNKSEKRMIALLLGLIFVFGNLFGLKFLTTQRDQLQQELKNLQAQKLTNDVWLEQKELWGKRRQWLLQNQPKLEDLNQGNVRLLEELQKQAKANDLTIVEQSLLDPRKTPDYQEVSARLRLSGSLESITRWLVALQQPTEFLAITDFSLKTDGDSAKFRCDLRVAKWYQSTN